jgi:hypothetical protein
LILTAVDATHLPALTELRHPIIELVFVRKAVDQSVSNRFLR